VKAGAIEKEKGSGEFESSPIEKEACSEELVTSSFEKEKGSGEFETSPYVLNQNFDIKKIDTLMS
jgi:hypothetical protein